MVKYYFFFYKYDNVNFKLVILILKVKISSFVINLVIIPSHTLEHFVLLPLIWFTGFKILVNERMQEYMQQRDFTHWRC